MVDRLDYKVMGFAILVLLCWMGYSPLAGRGAVIWSDDFNDGDYNGWTICENSVFDDGSEWSATNNYLQLDQEDGGIISHPSNIAYGKWSFDFRGIEANVSDLTFAAIAFISSNLDGDDWYDWTCYWIEFQATSTPQGYGFTLSLRKSFNGAHTAVVSYTPLVPATGWHHIDVTRTTAGKFSVKLNDSLVMEREDTDIDTSELFVFYAREWLMFDNVVVDDAPPIDWVPIIVIGVSAIAIIAVVVIYLKRR